MAPASTVPASKPMATRTSGSVIESLARMTGPAAPMIDLAICPGLADQPAPVVPGPRAIIARGPEKSVAISGPLHRQREHRAPHAGHNTPGRCSLPDRTVKLQLVNCT